MTRSRNLTLTAGALAAAALFAVAPSAPASTNTGSVRVPYSATVTVAGLPGRTAQIRTTLLVPNSWRRQKSRRTPVWLTGHGNCSYRVTTKATLTVALSSTAAVRVAADLPEVGPRILDSGTRNSAAWRVTRPEQAGRVHVQAVRAFTTATTRGATIPRGQSLWLEVWLDGLSRPGSECHSGTYREALGPQMGDVMATVRTRSYLR